VGAEQDKQKKEQKDDENMLGIYGITGEEFVLLAVTIALSLAQGKSTKQVRFLSNLTYQISVSLGAISTQKANQRAGNLIV